jgi:hypothetical protein
MGRLLLREECHFPKLWSVQRTMPQIKPPLVLRGRQEASTAAYAPDCTNFDVFAKRAYL